MASRTLVAAAIAVLVVAAGCGTAPKNVNAGPRFPRVGGSASSPATTEPAPAQLVPGAPDAPVAPGAPGAPPLVGGPAPAPLDPARLATGQWTAIPPGPLVTRGEPVAVWTGSEVIVVGGLLIDRYQVVVDGAVYNPATKTWRPIAPRPSPGRIFAGVWTGHELIVWGGNGIALNSEQPLSDGDAYNPVTNSWRTIAHNPKPFPALPPTVVWTGQRVLLWPASGGMSSTGALYDPATDTWTVIPPANLPGVISVGAGAWTGKVWAASALAGTGQGGPAGQTLALFDPRTNRWRAAPPAPPLGSGPSTHVVSTGKEVLLITDTTAVGYNPTTNQWRTAPSPDLSVAPGNFHTATLANGMLVAFVGNPATVLDVYDPRLDRWLASGPPPGALPASGAAVVPIGKSVMLFGIATEGFMVKPSQPNAAWIWTPA